MVKTTVKTDYVRMRGERETVEEWRERSDKLSLWKQGGVVNGETEKEAKGRAGNEKAGSGTNN